MFRVELHFANGEIDDEDDSEFETEEEAREHGYQMLSDYSQGVEVLSMHNLENSAEAEDAEVVVLEV